jgi:hypothetical protein
MSRLHRRIDRRLVAAATAGALSLVSCVISPHKEFVYSYETILVGHSYTDTVAKWPESKDVVSSTSTGSKVVEVNVKDHCKVFYEVDNDKITRAWDDGGEGCWKVN